MYVWYTPRQTFVTVGGTLTHTTPLSLTELLANDSRAVGKKRFSLL